jgi:hypothetical protein
MYIVGKGSVVVLALLVRIERGGGLCSWHLRGDVVGGVVGAFFEGEVCRGGPKCTRRCGDGDMFRLSKPCAARSNRFAARSKFRWTRRVDWIASLVVVEWSYVF